MRISWDRVGGGRSVVATGVWGRRVRFGGVGTSVSDTRWEGKKSVSLTGMRRSFDGDRKSNRVKSRSVVRTEGRISSYGGVDPRLAKGGLRKSFAEVVKGDVKDPVVASWLVGGLAGAQKEPAKVGVLSSTYDKFRLVPFKPRDVFMKEGRPAVMFSISEVELGKEKFGNSLVMRFQNGRPPPAALKKLISHSWKVFGSFSFSEILDEDHVLVKFELERDLMAALAFPGRSIGTFVFQIFKWRADYDPLHFQKWEKIWISLPNLPVFLFDSAFVEVIISSFAKLVKLDVGSEKCMNLKCLRACVEVMKANPIPAKVWIDLPHGRSYWQEVRVEGKWCSACRTFGHYNGGCAEVGLGSGIGKAFDGILDGNIAHSTPNKVDSDSDLCRSKEGLIPVIADAERSVHPALISVLAESSYERHVEDANQRHLVSHPIESNYVAECHNEDICCNVHHSNDKCAIVMEGRSSAVGVGVGDDLSIGGQIEPISAKPVEDQWQLVSRTKKKGGAASSTVSSVVLRNEKVVPPSNDASTLIPSNISAPTDGNVSVAEESSKSLAIRDNRDAYPSNVDHDFIDVGQCARLSPTCVQSPSMAKDYNIVPSCNKEPNDFLEVSVDHGIVCDGGPSSTTHETQIEASSKVCYGKEVGSSSSSWISNDGKVRNEQSGCTGHKNPINAASPFSPSVNTSGYLTSPVGQSKAAPCDSIELLRKKKGRHKLAYDMEGQNDQILKVPMSLPEDKIVSYGNAIVCYDENFAPLDARALYLHLKTKFSDDADIFHAMDHLYNTASQAQNDSPCEESKGSIDLYRILKHPRQKSKGSRKKKGSNVIY